MPASYYDTLRLTPTASPAEIRNAYRRMVGQWHPENWLQREQAIGDTMFRGLAEAFSMLSDPAMRAVYDQSLAGEPAARSPNAVDSEAALRIFSREMQGFAAELAAQGLAPEDVARYLISLSVPQAVARALAGLASPGQRGKSRKLPRRLLVLIGASAIGVMLAAAVLLRQPAPAPEAAPVVGQSAPAQEMKAEPSGSPTAPGASDAPSAAQTSAREFNRLMVEFEQRHPEFDANSPRYDASAADALRRRIEALEAKGFDSPEALRQAMSEYERLLDARAAASAPAKGASSSPRGGAPGTGAAIPNQPPPEGDALRTLCETFPHACRR